MTARILTHPLIVLRPSTLKRLFHSLLAAAALERSRRNLARLDDHLLRDIGLTRSEAMAEAARAPWDAPSHWMG